MYMFNYYYDKEKFDKSYIDTYRSEPLQSFKPEFDKSYSGTYCIESVQSYKPKYDDLMQNIEKTFDELNNRAILISGKSTFHETEQNNKVKINIQNNFNDKIREMIISITGRIPVSGETIYFSNLMFEILSATPKRIQDIRITCNYPIVLLFH